jgi:AcrR family transcriptional regulator
MAAPRTKRTEQAAATRRALVATATQLFVEKGYVATGTDEIVTRARVGTRGALYHHFPDKQALFEAVFVAVHRELAHDINAQVDHIARADALEDLRSRILVFLDTVVERADVRALLTEGPVALGWRRFRAIEFAYGAEPIKSALDRAVADGVIAPVPTGRLATLVVAAVDAAALEIAEAARPKAAKAEVSRALDAFVTGLRTSPASHASSLKGSQRSGDD